ncbi:MAG: hypothetical protein ABW101_17360 [Candidatus Thiodiazotropha sp.]
MLYFVNHAFHRPSGFGISVNAINIDDEVIIMATNPPSGDGHRNGAVRDRSQVYNPQNSRWTKRGPDGRFMDQKADNKPFKGVRKEK